MQSLSAIIRRDLDKLFESIVLDEDMISSLDGLAVRMPGPSAATLVLYNADEVDRYLSVMTNPRKLEDSDPPVLGAADITPVGNNTDYVSIKGVAAQKGYGPLLYAIAATWAGDFGSVLIPDSVLSNQAKQVWTQFDRNPFVTKVPVETAKFGFGIVGNGSLDLSGAIQKNDEIRKRHWVTYGLFISAANHWLDKAIRRAF